MTIHFAPAKGKPSALVCHPIMVSGVADKRIGSARNPGTHDRVKLGKPANDNRKSSLACKSGLGTVPVDAGSDKVIEAALRHFGQHGLGAARAARIRAKQAFFEGDRKAYDWWTAITYALDRRMIADAHQNTHPKGLPNGQRLMKPANSDEETREVPPGNAG